MSEKVRLFHFHLARPNPARVDPTRVDPNSTRPGPTRPDPGRPEPARTGPTPPPRALHTSERIRFFHPDLSRATPARPGPGWAQLGPSRPSLAMDGTSEAGERRPGQAEGLTNRDSPSLARPRNPTLGIPPVVADQKPFQLRQPEQGNPDALPG